MRNREEACTSTPTLTSGLWRYGGRLRPVTWLLSTAALVLRRSAIHWSSLPKKQNASSTDGIGRTLPGINDGKGFVFISQLGEVYPSGLLPLSGGNIRRQFLADIYRDSRSFAGCATARTWKGNAEICQYREICGGSHARSFAMKGAWFAEEPCCVYEPKPKLSPREKAQPVAG